MTSQEESPGSTSDSWQRDFDETSNARPRRSWNTRQQGASVGEDRQDDGGAGQDTVESTAPPSLGAAQSSVEGTAPPSSAAGSGTGAVQRTRAQYPLDPWHREGESMAPPYVTDPALANIMQKMLELQEQQMQQQQQQMQLLNNRWQTPDQPRTTTIPPRLEGGLPYHQGEVISDDQFKEYVGKDPRQRSGDRDREPRNDREPIPEWDGRHPGKYLRDWLKKLRLWRHETTMASDRHGLTLFKSFKKGTPLYEATCSIPEETLYSEQAWGVMLKEILTKFRPYLQLEAEITIEELMYHFDRKKGDSMTAYLTERNKKRSDMKCALGTEKIECPHCKEHWNRQIDLPDVMWSYMLKKGAHLSDDQLKTITHWDIARKELVGDKLIEVLTRLDRHDHTITAQGISNARQSLEGERRHHQHPTFDSVEGTAPPSHGGNYPAICDGNENDDGYSHAHGISSGIFVQLDSDGEEFEDDVSFGSTDSEDYDMSNVDSDGESLYDGDELKVFMMDYEGNPLPEDDNYHYNEFDAAFALGYASAYKQVRSKLQATKVGRDFKIV